MTDIEYHADEQINRLEMRINELAAEYEREQVRRTLALRAGDIRKAREQRWHLHTINSELAYLARQLTAYDQMQRHAS